MSSTSDLIGKRVLVGRGDGDYGNQYEATVVAATADGKYLKVVSWLGLWREWKRDYAVRLIARFVSVVLHTESRAS